MMQIAIDTSALVGLLDSQDIWHTAAEHALVDTCNGNAYCHGVAVMLESVPYLEYFPTHYGSLRCSLEGFTLTVETDGRLLMP